MGRLTGYYLTGTGNSYLAATWIAQAATEAGLSAHIAPIGSARPDVEVGRTAGDLLALCFPTHAFTTPWAMIRFALGLPPGLGVRALVLATRGAIELGGRLIRGLEGTSAYLVAAILMAKGYDVRGVRGVDMPSNWTIVHSAASDESARHLVARAEQVVKVYTHAVFAGQRRLEGRIELALGLGLAPVSLLYNVIGRFKLAKLFFATERCNACGLCARDCPHHAIRMAGDPPRPFWTYDCEGCMRCRSFCPTQAIETSYSFAVLASYRTGSAALAKLLALAGRRVPAVATLNRGWQGRLVSYGYGLVAMALVYRAFHSLIRIRAVNRLFALTTPTPRFRRYRAPDVTLGRMTGGER